MYHISESPPLAPGQISSLAMAPIGVFWDIENCCVPKGKSALAIVQRIRDKFFHGHRESEFMCACDISKESKEVIENLNNAQVTVVHINATSKNAADDKLRQSLRRFANAHQPPATVLLVSGDINFAAELSDLRHRHKLHIVLLHRKQVQDALLACAHEHYSYDELIADLPNKTSSKSSDGCLELVVNKLPTKHGVGLVKTRLKQLSDNCGGRVLKISGSNANIRFPNSDSAARAKKRMDGEDVYGSKIKVDFINGDLSKENEHVPVERLSPVQASPSKSHRVSPDKKYKGAKDKNCHQLSQGSPRTDKQPKENSHQLTQSSPRTDKQPKEINNNGTSPSKSQSQTSSESCKPADADIPPAKLNNTPTKSPLVKKSHPNGNKNQKNCSHAENCVKIEEENKGESTTAALPCNQGNKNNNSNSGITEDVGTKSSPQCGKKAAGFYGNSGWRNESTVPPRFRNNSGYRANSQSPDHYNNKQNKMQKDGTCTNSFSEALQRISQSKQRNFKDAVQRVGIEEKTTRTALFLQQQLYQEKQERCHSSCSTASSLSSHSYSPNIWNTPYPAREDCHSNPTFTWRSTSPMASPSQSFRSASQSPKGFRKTPGAKSGTRFNRTGGQSFMDSARLFQNTRSSSCIPLLCASDLQTGLNVGPYGQEVPELMVSNLDYNISAREWKKILFTEFQQQIKVLGVQIQAQPDGTNVGYVRVSTIDEARFAISQFHRKKIGYKRIHVSLVSNDLNSSAFSIRNEVIALLKEVTGNRLHLFKFIELFEKRFHRSISVSELYKLKDIVDIQDEVGAGRMVSLSPRVRNSPIPHDPNDQEVQEILESPVCKLHCHEGSELYMDAMDSCMLPSVHLQLRSFAAQVHTLLQTHNGDMPLMSFPSCYAAEFQPITPLISGGVPLEHLISNIPGVKIALSKFGIKKIQWAENKAPLSMELSGRCCSSPLMTQQLAQFSREVVDLLKHSIQCRMPFSKFIPAYHHHFGRQCRVADYGYTKLIELFEAIPHVVQILGCGSRRFVTLSHRSQVKRFTSDLLRVLKSQPTKEVTVAELSSVYAKVIGKAWDITDYGVSYVEDMLNELPDTTVIVSGMGNDMTISFPRRDQTKEEMDKTRQFSMEVVDLLKHSPQGRMPFNKFIPAYHHHFGKQCRVADYGFMKLIELFEAIPHVIQITEEQEEKILGLTEPQMLRVAAEQVTALLLSVPANQLPVNDFLSSFNRLNGHNLRLVDYNVESVTELINKLKNIAKIEVKNDVAMVVLIDQAHLQQVAYGVLQLLMDTPDGSMCVSVLKEKYQQGYTGTFNIHEVASELKDIVKVSGEEEDDTVKLAALQMFARDVRSLLHRHQGKIPLQMFESAYMQHFGVSLVPASYGFPNSVTMLQAIPHVVSFQGKGHNRMVLLSEDFQGQMRLLLAQSGRSLSPENCYDLSSHTPSNDSGITDPQDEEDHELLQFHSAQQSMGHRLAANSPVDLLAGPLPSAIPSPELTPYTAPSARQDLISFETSPTLMSAADILNTMTEEERKAQRTPLCRTPVSDMLQFAASLLPNQQPGMIHTVPVLAHYAHPPPPINMAYPQTQTIDVISYSTGCMDMPQMPLPVFQDRAILSMVTGSPVQHATLVPTSVQAVPVASIIMPTIYQQSRPHSDSSMYITSHQPAQAISQVIVTESNAQNSSCEDLGSQDLCVDQDHVLNQSTSSQKLGTPRKCRIAAKFNVPIETEEA